MLPVLPEVWRGDFHPSHTRWNASVPGYTAALMFNAAYDAARGVHVVVPELDLRWHRPDQVELDPRGYNARGDLAPPDVHLALDVLLESRPLSELEKVLLHHWIDSVWLRHSRSPIRPAQVIAALGMFSMEEVANLEAIVRAHALTDFRWVLHCVDPRERPVYGRTLNGPGKSRLFRMFPSRLRRGSRDPATWQEDDGGESGSSVDGSEQRPYAPLNAWQRFEQRMRWAERRMRRVLGRAQSAEDEARRQEERLEDAVERTREGRSILDVILRGLRARRGPFAGDRPVLFPLPYHANPA
ncbi:hypothetical protein EXIGLDRAFT_703758 [Exidia glandulosa HHB12029]|uniref:Uncharacterized protein n=1 Tax=Exidia glandulosa HHB12029 TaxID=1314781 RepID=A0A165ZCU0_EXIGL|nr:hypothetical protein EXIGLDRAFT_703758 [Exidia glandulosa HHB12029]